MMLRSLLCVGCLVLFSAVSALAAEPAKPAAKKPIAKPKPVPAAKPTATKPTLPPYECRWATGPITLDGRADEPAWAEAQPIDPAAFAVHWAKQPEDRPAKSTTRARLLWDGQNLYFHAEMEDRDLFADIVDHDGPTYMNDVFELFFKPDPAKTGYYEFEINPLNTRFDLYVPVPDYLKFDEYLKKDPFTWRTAVVRRGTLDDRTDRDEGWSVEGIIPWVDMVHTGARPIADETWSFALCRYDYNGAWPRPNLTSNALLARADFHLTADYAPIQFRGPPAGSIKPHGLETRTLLTTSKVQGSPEPPPPYRPVRAFPNLRLNHLIMLKREPGTQQLWGLVQPRGGGMEVIRFADHPSVTEYEVLQKLPGTATDFTFHPKFAENGYVYIGYNSPDESVPYGHSCRVSRFTVDLKSPARTIVPESELKIIEWSSNGHNGLAVEFGNDGLFYVTTGDGTSDSDTDLTGQDMTKLLAKLLRIDVDHVRPEDAARGMNYSVPSDNPFVGRPNIRPETWSYGFRNPWRMAVDRKTGHIWVTQNGQDLYEQVYLCRSGENYGWSVMEGSHPFYLERPRGPTPIVPPTVEHSHMEARSLTGGVVYYGEKYPELRGAYIYADYATGKIWMVRHDGTKVVENREIADTTLAITGFALDSRGELMVCDYQPNDQSAAYYLEPTPPLVNPPKFPRKLSESGLFAAEGGHRLVPGVIPYTVNSPLWSDGTYKERFIAVPDEAKVEFNNGRSWNFPEGTVLIKSFALEKTAGDPASRHWIETRFMTKQQNEWVGYSYAWNEDQTDAELVESKGLDREYEIADVAAPGGLRKQKWHYPSRAECMICHSRAANFVLGLSTVQMNCELDYGGVRDNQIRTLSHIGLFTKPAVADWSSIVIRTARDEGMNQAEANAYWRDALPKNQRRLSPPPTAEADADSFERLANPADESAPLEARARSYLHANCAHCHTSAGGGNAQIELGINRSIWETKMWNERPLHSQFDLKDARIIAPGSPERSVLAHRMSLEVRGRMPPIAVSVADKFGVDLVSRWIASLPSERPATQVEFNWPSPTRVSSDE